MWFIVARLLLIAQPFSYRIAPFLAAAQTLGLEVVIASRGEFSLVSEVHQGIHINFDDPDQALNQILDFAEHQPFVGVLGCDDSTVEIAARAAAQLNLPHNVPEAARLSCRKDLARVHLAKANCKVPRHCLVNLTEPFSAQLKTIDWPVVVKPLNLSASRGVIRANNAEAFSQACTRISAIINNSHDPFLATHVLVEQYIEGVEVAFEGFLSAGDLTTITLFDKPDPLQGPYFEETIYVTPSQLDHDIQLQIEQSVSEACRAYGLVTGPVHAELRVNEEGAWILEVASRTIGGECARVLDSDDGVNLEALTVALAIGYPAEFQNPESARGVMMIPIKKQGMLRRVEGIGKARAVQNIDKVDITIREGNQLIPLPEGNQYLGYIFASGETSSDVVTALRTAHEALNFVVVPVFKLGTV